MDNIIIKKKKSCMIFKIVLIILAAIFLLSFPLSAILNVNGLQVNFALLVVPLSLVLFILFIIYVNKCLQFNRSLKLFDNNQLKNVADDIEASNCFLPKSKIRCGNRTFYSTKTAVLIPYNMIRWVYVRKVKAYGITTQKSIEIFCTGNIHFSISADIDEFTWLINNYIQPQSPDLILGYGKAQSQKYKEIIE